ncbi:hypothetical protein PanWU01x14_279010, partial [Parasponia andersonii]
NRSHGLKRRVASVQPNTTQHGSFHERKPEEGFQFSALSHLGLYPQHLSVQSPPYSAQKGARGKDETVPSSTHKRLPFYLLCPEQLGALWKFLWRKDLMEGAREQLPLLSSPELTIHTHGITAWVLVQWN